MASHSAISAIWRIEAPRLIGALVRFTRDIDLAEDLAQEAFLAALEHWPSSGVPDSPGAWLMATAKHRAVDGARRRRMMVTKQGALTEAFERAQDAMQEQASPCPVGDDLLRLMLVACHPVLSQEARVALTLRLLGGLTTVEIARAFVVPEATIAQRIVRAKRTLREARVPFDVPEGQELAQRLPWVRDVIYLIFNEGYVASTGQHWLRPELAWEAMRLGRVLTALVPEEAESHALVALMELQASRFRARTDDQGRPVPLLAQNRANWDHSLIQHGLKALSRAEASQAPSGVFTLQAAIAGCHARAATADRTDWVKIVALYDALVELTGSPIVELNRAVAIAMAFGPAEGLTLIDELQAGGTLDAYHHLPAARGELCERLGRLEEARSAFDRAAELTTNEQERAVLLERAARLASPMK